MLDPFPDVCLMRRTSLLAVAAMMTMCAACDKVTGLAATLPYVVAVPECAPSDSPALTFVFSEQPITRATSGPLVLLTVYRPATDLAGRSYRFAEPNDETAARVFTSFESSAGVVTGTLQVERVEPGVSVLGHANLVLPDGSRLRRAFVAPWRPGTFACL